MTLIQRLEEIKARLAAATPGPWEADKAVWPYEGEHQGKESRAIYYRPTEGHIIEVIESPDELHGECIHNESDWKLIANAPTDIAFLVEALELCLRWIDKRVCREHDPRTMEVLLEQLEALAEKEKR